MKIVVLDYGMGNLHSVTSTLRYLGVDEIIISAKYDDIKKADKLILPGVGAFGKAMDRIRSQQIDIMLKEVVQYGKKPLLGICLGMQLLGLSSTEDGVNAGLGFINGKVLRFNEENLAIPHVGFNQVFSHPNSKLYRGLDKASDFYFTHSYRMTSEVNINQSMCNYGSDFIASFEVDNIVGVQFHPELSQQNGLKLLKNFIDLL
ncbi:imidazole glycerol phosphate synthase subunit HisH [Sediminibacterium sp. KACHI17]|uniref:Imidazole glycerol phosphate synthase subunit HisH n=1 Tax=Sediminibacterium sp. KACHI17 TaxID=1751071 RepID=A0AAT9GIQ5_9BACT